MAEHGESEAAMGLTRRGFVSGALSLGANAAWANAPASSIRPAHRAPDFFKRAVKPADELIGLARLGGSVSYAVADARTGQMLEVRAPLKGQPPASTAKTMTSLYALDALGPAHVFRTRLVATGPISNGRIDGDLILAGGGDPTLDTDALAAMAAQLKAAGVREIAGRFKVWDGSLPRLFRIDPEQPDHVGYNPALSGLDLNFNRVHFGWEKSGGGYAVSMDARSAHFVPDVTVARMRVVDRSLPVYTYAEVEGRDEWTVARTALGNGGARWLPVRHPAKYAGEVFKVLARSHGIVLGTGVGRAESPEGNVLVDHESAPLRAILRDMLKYSTNVTAEIVGLSASAAVGPLPGDLKTSAARMNGWLGQQLGGQAPAFEDHSGLGDDSRISAATMVKALVRTGPDGILRDLMKPFRVDALADGAVKAKTGTLNFVNALTGYVTAPDGTDLAFAIFCSDTARRDALPMAERERPEGGRAYANRARTLQRGLLARWSVIYGA